VIDITTDLKGRFEFAKLHYLEKWETDGVGPDGDVTPDIWTDDERKAIGLFEKLHDTVGVIPPSLIETAEKLRSVAPEVFEHTLVLGVQVVGFGFFASGATEFVEALNRTVQRDIADA
jgi:hypothetical protein